MRELGDEDPAPGDGLSGTLSIEGSSTVAPYTRLAIDAFEERNAGATVTATATGTANVSPVFTRMSSVHFAISTPR